MSLETRFSVVEDQLLYDGRPVTDDAGRPAFPRLRLDPQPVGAGGNGTVFRALHKVLGTEQIVKLYEPHPGAVGDEGVRRPFHLLRLGASQGEQAGVRATMAVLAADEWYAVPVPWGVMEDS